jgi:hypothetical protein
MTRLSALCLLPLWLTSCSSTAVSQPSAAEQTVDELAKQADQQFVGQIVQISGRFGGWQGRCQGGPPVSRSDWMLEGEQACLYVNGRLPAGLQQPPHKSDRGTPVTLRARLQRDRDKRLYLERVD